MVFGGARVLQVAGGVQWVTKSNVCLPRTVWGGILGAFACSTLKWGRMGVFWRPGLPRPGKRVAHGCASRQKVVLCCGGGCCVVWWGRSAWLGCIWGRTWGRIDGPAVGSLGVLACTGGWCYVVFGGARVLQVAGGVQWVTKRNVCRSLVVRGAFGVPLRAHPSPP